MWEKLRRVASPGGGWTAKRTVRATRVGCVCVCALQSGCLRNSGLYMAKGLGAFRLWILGIISSEVSRPHFWKRNWLKHHGLGVTSWKLSQAPLVLVLALCSLCLGLFSSSSSVSMCLGGFVSSGRRRAKEEVGQPPRLVRVRKTWPVR